MTLKQCNEIATPIKATLFGNPKLSLSTLRYITGTKVHKMGALIVHNNEGGERERGNGDTVLIAYIKEMVILLCLHQIGGIRNLAR